MFNINSVHRYSTIQNTMIELFISLHCKNFLGTKHSSLSTLVIQYQNIFKHNNISWC